jgi:hypothetical protein
MSRLLWSVLNRKSDNEEHLLDDVVTLAATLSPSIAIKGYKLFLKQLSDLFPAKQATNENFQMLLSLSLQGIFREADIILIIWNLINRFKVSSCCLNLFGHNIRLL